MRLAEDTDEVGTAGAAVVQVAEQHPDDIGLVVLLLMHHRVLRPGEYIDVAAGVLHSYVHGLGIEVLANSDNVVRAGLTSKEVNVPELLRILDPPPTASPAGRYRSPTVSRSSRAPPTASSCTASSPAATYRASGPRLVFCLRGRVHVTSAHGSLELGDAESAFLPDAEGPVRLEGTGEVYVVTVPGL